MAYSRKVRETARRYWLLGYSDEKIVPLLKADFPDEPTPNRPNTILAWRQAEVWETDLEIIAAKAQEKRREELATELAAMNAQQLALLALVNGHVQVKLMISLIKDSDGKVKDSRLSDPGLLQIMTTLEKSIKSQRLIRNLPTTQARVDSAMKIEWEQLTDEQLERLVSGESPENLLADSGFGGT